jgi:ketosteroid isomerase-like protein
MKRRTMIRAGITGVGLLAASGSRAEQARDLIELDAQLNRWILAHDAQSAARLYDDEFVLTAGNGVFKSKGAMLADIADPAVELSRCETLEPRVIVRGNAAVLLGLLVQEGRVRGREISARLRVTDTWVRQGTDGWVLLAGHASLMKPT